MWCRNCRQDVPGIATSDTGVLRCAKCQQEAAAPAAAGGPAETGVSSNWTVPEWAFVERPPIDLDSWQWDVDIHEARRWVRTHGLAHEPQSADPPDPRAPAQTGHPERPRSGWPATRRRAVPPRSAGIPLLAWTVLSLGIMALVFGGVLLGWSCWSGHQKLWMLGLPFALGGQAALIIGFVLQLDGVWQTSREAETALQELDEQMGDLRQAATLLTKSHSGPAQSFYFHLAEGASPHLLLADLKGQLDLLAMRMGNDAGR